MKDETMEYIYDCETDNLLSELTKVHCLVFKDTATGHIYSCHDQKHWTNPREGQGLTTLTLAEGLRLIAKADRRVGHNVIPFDDPALTKVYPWFAPEGDAIDTLLMSRLIWPSIKDGDLIRIKKGTLPRNLVGRYSLESWGFRLGAHKGDFKGPWAHWTPEMQLYCEQDVEVTHQLYKLIQSKGYSEQASRIEHDFLEVISRMERVGFCFNRDLASDLYARLCQRRLELELQLHETFKPWWAPVGVFTPKRPNATMGYVAGAPLTKVELRTFKPTEREKVAERLITLFGWEPTEYTDDGKPKVDDETLQSLPWPEAALLAEYYMVTKRIGQLGEGKQAWLKLERNGRIHGRVVTVGAITRRCTHSGPNVSQAPAVDVPYGAEMRACFVAALNMVQVGADASGIELRCLAHYLSKIDGGAFQRELLEGDIHWVNVQALGITNDNRDKHSKVHDVYRGGAKTFIYAFLYGAGDEKIGRILLEVILKLKALGLPYENLNKLFFAGKEVPNAADLSRVGKRMKNDFLRKTPALKILRERIASMIKAQRQAGKKPTLKAIDGGLLHIRSAHSALNTLLQACGAIIVKLATVLWDREMRARGYVWVDDYTLVAHIHDELQMNTKEGIEDECGQVAVESIRKAGEQLGLRCPLDGEYKVGRNWAACH